ncbi:MAG: UDP-N-acetyl-D-glucosamine dehydrogenase [Solirubrobacteraceae bacterium]|jgi:UDP-N-acetyl-D-glucosamine dehydrogenase|nr:UDP-N-acetyl-D-glucosamine dehydrogenase [Solirubrobacteraceae bacterium]
MTVGIIGLGYVGLPLAVAFAEAGSPVIGVDVDAERVESLRAGRSDIEDIPDSQLAAIAERLTFDTDYGALRDADAVLICVPTPLTPQREPDLGPLLASTESLSGVLREGQLVVLESTTYPGTTRERLLPMLEASGLRLGEGFNLAFSPERVDPGSERFTIQNTPKVVGGLTPACGDRAEALYATICEQVVRVSSPETAEMSKLLENIFRSVNIALVNEMATIAHRMGIDVWEVIDAAATKPFGFMRFDPGPGMGGHCLPVDPFYLSWRAREYDLTAEFIELAGKVNQSQPYYCEQRVVESLNDSGKPVKGSNILVLGVAYKPGVGDMRESPALKLIELLRRHGARLSYHDSFVPELPELALSSRDLAPAVQEADLVVIVTAHPDVDHEDVARTAALTLDLRGVTRAVDAPNVQRL